MCGILGVVGREVPAAAVERMAGSMRHRGPDASGILRFQNGALAHRRLCILDVSEAANQPLADPDEQAAVVFNGEIYNYQELRHELEQHGFHFRTTSDTEVLLHGYLHWGRELLPRLNGMFAFGIWDLRRQELFLARDRLGKKPLYLAHLSDGSLIFSSELKAMLAGGLIDTTIDTEAVVDYLHLNYVLCPKTMLKQVRQVPPGHFALWADGVLGMSRYWNLAESFLAPRLAPATTEAVLDRLDALLLDATRTRLFSDVPLGAFLSGGVDSSTVVAMIRRAGCTDLHTFSIEFPQAHYNEGQFSRLAANHLGTHHHPKLIDGKVADLLPRVAALLDCPLGDDSTISQYLLSRWAREKVTVALTGDGADELFAGYITYQADWLHRRLGWLRSPLGRVLRWLSRIVPESSAKLSRRFRLRQLGHGLAGDPSTAHFCWRQVHDPAENRLVCARELAAAVRHYHPSEIFRGYFDEVRGADWLDRLLYVDSQTWLRDDVLVKVDRASMAASLECRSPFLDYRVVEFAARLPRRFKLNKFEKKSGLRALARRLLPRAIVDRKKTGFNSPTDVWLQGDLREMAREILAGPALEPFGIRWRNGVESLWEQYQRGHRQHQYVLWGLFMLALWQENVLAAVDLMGTGSAPVRAAAA